jgi:antirestriction protein ArdC
MSNTKTRPENRGCRPNRVPRDHYQEVTDRIIAALEAGTPPWRKPWDPDKAGGPAMPRNAVTGHKYRGINVLTLGMSALAFASSDPRWATYKQAEERGWQVRRGGRGTTGYFFKRLELRDDTKPDDDDDAVRRIPLLRAFTLFHASQIEGIPTYVPPTIEEAPWRAPEATEIILANSGAVVRYGGERAFYSPATDHIQMPPHAAFTTAEGYCGTLVHELSHNAAIRIMPHGLRWRLVFLASAMRLFGIIRVLPGTRGVDRRAGTGSTGWLGPRRERAPSPSSACRRGCRFAWSRQTRVQATGRSPLDRHHDGAGPSQCCGEVYAA